MAYFFDSGSYLKDVIKARHEYKNLDYRVKKIKDGKVTFIEVFRKNEDSTTKCFFETAPQLVLEEALYKLGDGAISRYIKAAATNIILLIASHLTGWHSAKAALYRFLGAKIGKHCLISHYSRFDPLMPNKIEMEDYAGIGMEVYYLPIVLLIEKVLWDLDMALLNYVNIAVLELVLQFYPVSQLEKELS